MTSKRVMDVVVACVAVPLLAPFFLLITIWILVTTGGPVLFRQTRVGQDGSHFKIIKFCSMDPGTALSGPLITLAKDNRVTSVGRILRRYKLDELPQLLNIIKGDMTLVGPRPEVPKYVDFYPKQSRKIVLSVRPGLTDPASLIFIDESAILTQHEHAEKYYIEKIIPEKLRIYERYVSSQTTVGDFKIILETLLKIFRLTKR